MAKGMTNRQDSKPEKCGKCGLPHIFVGGLCPEDGPEARAKFDTALKGWATYESRMQDRRRKGWA